jgi:hypothetical protein
MAIEKLGNLCGQHHARKERIDIDPKPSAHDACRTRGCDSGLLNPIEMRSGFLVKASSFVCESYGACSALKEPHTDPLSSRPIARPTPDDVRPSASAARAIEPASTTANWFARSASAVAMYFE